MSAQSSLSESFDIIVIGAGSGGVRLSRIAAGLGAKVAVIEEQYLGGTCVNIGCVPKKLFVYAAHYREDFHDASGYGWNAENIRFDWKVLKQNKDNEITRLNGIYRNLLANAGVQLIEGRGKLTGPTTVEVNGKTLQAKKIVIATGGTPNIPDIPGKALLKTSTDMFYLDKIPSSAVVWGGGYIAVEFAGILAGLGVKTTLIYRGDMFLRGFDEDVRQFVRAELEKKGIELRFGENIAKVDKVDGGNLQVTLTSGDTPVITGLVLAATGRIPNTAGLGLESTTVTLNSAGEIIVDNNFRSTCDSIYAVGDVIGGMQLTPVALAEGQALAHHLVKGAPVMVDYDYIPTAVFCQPTIGTVGFTEAQARKKFGKIRVYRSEFRPMKYTMNENTERCLMKLIVDDASDKVVGAHMVGAEAGEIIQGMAVAIKAGATKAHFDATIGIHPTAAEEFVTMRTPVSS
ncbi:MAG: glutathione-disulfide reductase [Hahellaceae bacterium]|nr:glutathione-disulfide reductase [Hahellaceae bacterium]MCP5212981.1 glutathione-disulfide reductase [Hahellaceae bacterium]